MAIKQLTNNAISDGDIARSHRKTINANFAEMHLRSNTIVIAVTAQSNGSGQGPLPALIRRALAGCYMIGKDNIYRDLVEPSHKLYAGAVDNWTPYGGDPTAKYSLATSLANWVRRLTGCNVLILPCAIGATSIANWLDQAYIDPPVETSLFGQMRKRIDLATGGDYSRLIILHHGHEGAVGGTTASRALDWHNLTEAYHYWFGVNVPIVIPQIALHTDGPTNLLMAAGADTQWRLDQDYGDSTTNTGAYTTSLIKTTNAGVAAAASDWLAQNTNANNSIIDTAGGINFVQDGTNPLGLTMALTALVVGKTYRIKFIAVCTTGLFKIAVNAANPTSSWKLNNVDQAVSAQNLGSGAYEFVFAYTGSNFNIQRNSSGQTANMAFTAMTIEEAVFPKHANVFTYPTWDLAMNGSTDAYHLATAGLDEDGRRSAYVIASRVLGLPGLMNGPNSHVGHPHLTSARNVGGSTTVVSLFFNQAIANVGSTNLYLVEVGSVAQTISGVAINGSDPTRVDITLSAPITAGSETVSYAAVQENTDGSAFTNFLRNTEGLPPLRFYRYTVAAT